MERLVQFLDFFIPRFCLSCRVKLHSKEIYLCSECSDKIIRPTENRIAQEFNKKFEKGKIISGFTSAYLFEKDKPLQHLIHSLKYEENFKIGIYLGKKVAELCKESIINWKADYLLPVPLHHLKKAERGYNQSYFIVKGISSLLKINLNTGILKRKKYTSTQTELTLLERKSNIKDAFTIEKIKPIKDKIIILVDDVITTGATITECGEVLLKNGAAKVYALSVAIAD